MLLAINFNSSSFFFTSEYGIIQNMNSQQAVFTWLLPSFKEKYKKIHEPKKKNLHVPSCDSSRSMFAVPPWLECLFYDHFSNLYSLQNTCQICYPNYLLSLLYPPTCETTPCAIKAQVCFENHHIKKDWFSSWKCQTSACNAQLHFSGAVKFKKEPQPWHISDTSW